MLLAEDVLNKIAWAIKEITEEAKGSVVTITYKRLASLIINNMQYISNEDEVKSMIIRLSKNIISPGLTNLGCMRIDRPITKYVCPIGLFMDKNIDEIKKLLLEASNTGSIQVSWRTVYVVVNYVNNYMRVAELLAEAFNLAIKNNKEHVTIKFTPHTPVNTQIIENIINVLTLRLKCIKTYTSIICPPLFTMSAPKIAASLYKLFTTEEELQKIPIREGP